MISRQEGAAASYYIYDGGFSVRALTNEAGTVTDTLVFDAFGNETAKTGSTDNAYGFQGEEKDETGLYYLRARYMDPSTGTFTSMDTYGGSLSDPMSLHKYMFANSNPVAYCDPGGHEASLQGMVAAMAISGILSAVDSGILYSLQNRDSDIEKYGKSVYGWNVVTAAMNGFLNGFIMGFIGYALCLVLVFRFILSAVGLCIGIPLIASGLDEINSPNGNKALGAYTIAKGVIITIVSTVGLAKSGAELFNKYGKGGNLIHLEGDPNIEGDGDWGDINKEIDDWYNSSTPEDVYSFGNKNAPRGARPQQDFNVNDNNSLIGPERGPLPKGASNVNNIKNASLTGHYHKLPAGTKLPRGLGIIADGSDVNPNSSHIPGHYTVYPTQEMTVDEFNKLYKGLPWQYGGKKQ